MGIGHVRGVVGCHVHVASMCLKSIPQKVQVIAKTCVPDTSAALMSDRLANVHQIIPVGSKGRNLGNYLNA